MKKSLKLLTIISTTSSSLILPLALSASCKGEEKTQQTNLDALKQFIKSIEDEKLLDDLQIVATDDTSLIEKGKKFTTQTSKEAFINALSEAKAVTEESKAKEAKNKLEQAIFSFKKTIKIGTKENNPGTPNLNALKQTIKKVEDKKLLDNIFITDITNPAFIPEGKKFTSQHTIDEFEKALKEAKAVTEESKAKTAKTLLEAAVIVFEQKIKIGTKNVTSTTPNLDALRNAINKIKSEKNVLLINLLITTETNVANIIAGTKFTSQTVVDEIEQAIKTAEKVVEESQAKAAKDALEVAFNKFKSLIKTGTKVDVFVPLKEEIEKAKNLLNSVLITSETDPANIAKDKKFVSTELGNKLNAVIDESVAFNNESEVNTQITKLKNICAEFSAGIKTGTKVISSEINGFTKKSIKFVNDANDDYKIKADKLNIYTKADKPTIYVDLEDIVKSLDGFLDSKYFGQIKKDPHFNIFSAVEDTYMKINWEDDTISFNNLAAFSFTKDDESSDWLKYLNRVNVNEKDFNTNEIVYDLKKYDIDLLNVEDHTLIPLWLFNILFCSPNYYNLYYTGDAIVGVSETMSEGDEDEDTGDFVATSYRKNSLNNATQTVDERKEVYNQFLFIMDYFYGLKDHKNITSFADFITTEQKANFLSTDPKKNIKAYTDIIYGKLNELHSTIHMFSFYNKPELTLDTLYDELKIDITAIGGKYKTYLDQLDKLEKSRRAGIIQKQDAENDSDFVFFYGDTAFIVCDGFNLATEAELKDPNLQDSLYTIDTYTLFKEAMEWIKTEREDKGLPVKNVVLDLSQNGGGSVAAMIKTIGFLSSDPVSLHSYNPIDDRIVTETWRVDTNADGKYDEKDGYSKYKWSILTGLNTFSAGNSFAAVSQRYGWAKIIGQKTGGGMCSILPFCLIDGTSFGISSNDLETLYDGTTKTFVEDGVTPDIELSYDKFYDFQYIDNLLK